MNKHYWCILNYETDQSQFIYTLRDMYKEVIKGIDTKTRVRGNICKFAPILPIFIV